MTRIAYVCADPGIPVFGCKGASIHVQEVVRSLRRAGTEVHLHAARLGGQPPADLANLPVTLLAPEDTGVAPAAAGSDATTAAAGTTAVRATAMQAASEAECRARAALRANRRLHDALITNGPFDLVYERYSLWSFGAIAFACGRGACTSLLEVNAPLIDEQAAWRELPLPGRARRVAAYLFRHADRLLAVSPGVAGWLQGFGGAADRIRVVPNGVDPSRFAPRDPGPAAGGPITIGFVGTLKPWHGLPTLIEAWARLRTSGVDARLLLVGDGPERDRLLADLQARGLAAHADLTGAVAPDRVPALLARMDIAVAPYPPRDDFYFSPLKLYEYLAAGLPVVCSRVGHLDRVIDDGRDGLLFAPGDAAALAASLARLIESPALRSRLGRAGRARVMADHTWNGVAKRILALAAEAATARQGAKAAGTGETDR